jgi:hypothetical protein
MFDALPGFKQHFGDLVVHATKVDCEKRHLALRERVREANAGAAADDSVLARGEGLRTDSSKEDAMDEAAGAGASTCPDSHGDPLASTSAPTTASDLGSDLTTDAAVLRRYFRTTWHTEGVVYALLFRQHRDSMEVNIPG